MQSPAAETNVAELIQRLVPKGLLPSGKAVAEHKGEEEAKPVGFEKPETLHICSLTRRSRVLYFKCPDLS
jgi:hypothetical protein